MKLEFEHIKFDFVRIEGEGKIKGKRIYYCKNISSGAVLGKVRFWNGFKQYCFSPDSRNTCYSSSDMMDIIFFLEQLNK
jgi:hypothetical protein